jgi:hypothetical protein
MLIDPNWKLLSQPVTNFTILHHTSPTRKPSSSKPYSEVLCRRRALSEDQPNPLFLRFGELGPFGDLGGCIALVFAPRPWEFYCTGKLYDWVCGNVDDAKGIIFVQAVTYNSQTKQVTWWMDRERVAFMRKERWIMGIVRLDAWGPAGPVNLFNAKELEGWCDDA